MTFFVGTKTRRTWKLEDMADNSDVDFGEGTEVYWVFRFANDDLAKVDGTINTDDDTVSFQTPSDLFTEDRQGPCKHALRIKITGSNIDTFTDPITEDVELNVATISEVDDL